MRMRKAIDFLRPERPNPLLRWWFIAPKPEEAPPSPVKPPVDEARKELRLKAGLDSPTVITPEDSIAIGRHLQR